MARTDGMNAADIDLYKPCPWCEDRGCLACDHLRVQRLQRKRQEAEAREFLRDYLRDPEQPDVELIPAPHTVHIAMAAIEWGKAQVRGEREQEPKSVSLEARFALLEYRAEVAA